MIKNAHWSNYELILQFCVHIIISKNRSYWSSKWPFRNDNFRSVMSGRRFELLMRFLHFNDSATQASPWWCQLWPPLQSETIPWPSRAEFQGCICSNSKSVSGWKHHWIQRAALMDTVSLQETNQVGMKAWVLADSVHMELEACKGGGVCRANVWWYHPVPQVQRQARSSSAVHLPWRFYHWEAMTNTLGKWGDRDSDCSRGLQPVHGRSGQIWPT